MSRLLWKDRPTWFLTADQDPMIVLATQRFMAVDHAPIVTAPRLGRRHHQRGNQASAQQLIDPIHDRVPVFRDRREPER